MIHYDIITPSQAYEDYSFEELRYAAPVARRPLETMLVRCHGDATFSASWTPSVSTHYRLLVTIDGYDTGEV